MTIQGNTSAGDQDTLDVQLEDTEGQDYEDEYQVPDQSWSLMDLAFKDTPFSWEDAFETARGELELLDSILERKGYYFPLKKDLFAAFKNTELYNVKVVILGQDPYPGYRTVNGEPIPDATGMAFSTRKDAKINGSLQNIFKELVDTLPNFDVPLHGDLTPWAYQGVLLLNSCLTVEPSKPGSHKGIWYPFISRILKAVLEANPQVVFLAWGMQSQNLLTNLKLGNINRLDAGHPSDRGNGGFFGNDHFRKVNRHLSNCRTKREKAGKPPLSIYENIDWQL